MRFELMLPHEIRTAIAKSWPVVLPLDRHFHNGYYETPGWTLPCQYSQVKRGGTLFSGHGTKFQIPRSSFAEIVGKAYVS